MQNKFTKLSGLLLAAGLSLMLLALSKPAHADIEYFPFTYEWYTSGQGEVEVGLKQTQPANGSRFNDQLELEYGVTDRYMVEAYLVYNESGGIHDTSTTELPEVAGHLSSPKIAAAYRYGGFQIEQRYRFGNYGVKKLLTAAYVEYEQDIGETPGVEMKAIFQYDPNTHTTFALNLIEEPHLYGDVVDYGYSFGGAYMPAKKRYWYGGEMLGSGTDKTGYIGPTIGTWITDDTRVVGTYGKQFMGGGGDVFRILLSWEIR